MMRPKSSGFVVKNGSKRVKGCSAMDSRFRDIVDQLDGRGVMPKTQPALLPTRRALDALEILSWPFFKNFDPQKVIIVAGTNGKGSVCATLETLLLAAGENVGLYTSPHLMDITERIRVGGRDINQTLFCDAFEAVEEVVGHLKLTHFEMITVMALWVFASGRATKLVDRIILEVGLGGLWDATNAIPHGACVITSLGFDHQSFLGNTIEEIASNKFAVIPHEKDLGQRALVVHSKLPSETEALALKVRTETNSDWIEAKRGSLRVSEGPRYEISTPWGAAEIALAGRRGLENTMTALTMFEALGFEPAKFLRSLKSVSWPGRMELIESDPVPIYLSGDHNEQGVQSLIELLPNYSRKHLHILTGIGVDKAFDEMLELLSSVPNSSLYLTQTTFKPRALEDYGKWKTKVRGSWSNPEVALENVRAFAKSGDMILVTGSLYLVGSLRSQLLKTKIRT